MGPGPVAAIQSLVADHYAIPRRLMMSREMVKPAPQARQVAMYLAHIVLGKGPTELGRRFNRDHSTVGYSIRTVAASQSLLAEATMLRERMA